MNGIEVVVSSDQLNIAICRRWPNTTMIYAVGPKQAHTTSFFSQNQWILWKEWYCFIVPYDHKRYIGWSCTLSPNLVPSSLCLGTYNLHYLINPQCWSIPLVSMLLANLTTSSLWWPLSRLECVIIHINLFSWSNKYSLNQSTSVLLLLSRCGTEAALVEIINYKSTVHYRILTILISDQFINIIWQCFRVCIQILRMEREFSHFITRPILFFWIKYQSIANTAYHSCWVSPVSSAS